MYRIWIPNADTPRGPGLAISRAFGDYVIKDFGLVSEPEVTQRNITCDDQFVILATDGVCIISVLLNLTPPNYGIKNIIKTTASSYTDIYDVNNHNNLCFRCGMLYRIKKPSRLFLQVQIGKHLLRDWLNSRLKHGSARDEVLQLMTSQLFACFFTLLHPLNKATP